MIADLVRGVRAWSCLKPAAFLILGLAAVCQGVKGDTIFTNAADFYAATSDLMGISFDGIVPGGTQFEGFSPLMVVGVTFSTPIVGVTVNVTRANYYSPYDYPGDFIVNSENPGNNELDIALPTPAYTLALTYGGYAGGNDGLFTLSDGQTFDQPSLPSVGHLDFLGFITTTPITSLSFVTTNDAWVVDELSLPTPEPSSMSLLAWGMALGMVSMVGGVYRRKRAAATGSRLPNTLPNL